MTWFEALILGIVQGLTEFLPVSSSGHLEIGKHLLNVEATDSLGFTVAVHGATVLSTLIVFRKDIAALFAGLFKFKWNDETKYIAMIIISMLPIAIVGFTVKDSVEAIFQSPNIMLIVGCMLLLTALLLTFAYFRKSNARKIGFLDALIIGVAQTIAIMPGLSRSGTTIATGILLGNKKGEVARFSFLMVLTPIIGENLLDIMKSAPVSEAAAAGTTSVLPIVVGFIAAFAVGLLSCKWMVKLVREGKLIYFAVYCALVGVLAIAGSVL
ncbi:MAG: undecaprenyl-diphosphate phosphatase [Cytophagaceae bacterium]|jgi:undecaprenyl-diphosphatase|nr:undecaprenyl-diphosphate phosphatase [Cytophagaceae bacterium]